MIVINFYKVLNIHWIYKIHSSELLPVMLVKRNRLKLS